MPTKFLPAPKREYDDWLYSLSKACLEQTMLDCLSFSFRRHKQHLRSGGKDWIRYNPDRAGEFIPKIYIELREHIEWLYSWRFGFMSDLFDADVEKMREFYLKLIAGLISEEDVLQRN